MSDFTDELRAGLHRSCGQGISPCDSCRDLMQAMDRIEELEAKMALYEELERQVRSAPIYPGLSVEMALLAIEDSDDMHHISGREYGAGENFAGTDTVYPTGGAS